MAIQQRDYVQTQDYAGVTSFTSRVYGWMTVGLLVTTLVALCLIHTGAYMKFLSMWWLAPLGCLGLGLAFNGMAHRLSSGAMGGLFLAYAALQGLFFGTVLPLYAAAVGGQVIYLAFLTAAATFGMAILYGLFTKNDLTRFAPIFRLALFALIGATMIFFIASLFVSVTFFHLLICYAGLLLFVGLTAYDAQTIRKLSYQVENGSLVASKASLMMAMRMYINVIMIFWYLLQIFSGSRSSR